MDRSLFMPSMQEEARRYIRGFFDRLCAVDADGRSIVLTTNQVDLGRRVGALIRHLGIRCSILALQTNVGPVVKLRISGRKPLEAWAKEIGFEPEKMVKLDRVLASYRRRNVSPTGTAERTAEAEAQGIPGEPGSQD